MTLVIPKEYSFHEYVTYNFSWPEKAEAEYDYFVARFEDYNRYLEGGGEVDLRTWMYVEQRTKDPYDWDYSDLFCTMSRYINGDCECRGKFECPFALKGDSCMEYLLSKKKYPVRLRKKISRQCVETLKQHRAVLIPMLRDMKAELLELEKQADDEDEFIIDDGARDSDYEEGR